LNSSHATSGNRVREHGNATLADAAIGEPLIVREVVCPPKAPDWGRWLAEIGFLPDEPAMLLGCFAPGRDPLVVRIGVSTFALRRAEAACVRVAPAGPRDSA
jgi:ferrous iron transport protein A